MVSGGDNITIENIEAITFDSAETTFHRTLDSFDFATSETAKYTRFTKSGCTLRVRKEKKGTIDVSFYVDGIKNQQTISSILPGLVHTVKMRTELQNNSLKPQAMTIDHIALAVDHGQALFDKS